LRDNRDSTTHDASEFKSEKAAEKPAADLAGYEVLILFRLA
jgi:hypothetical protein